MVVAAGAGDGETHQSSAHHIDLFVNDVIQHLRLIRFGEQLRAERQKSGGHNAALIDLVGLVGWQQISRDLFHNDLIVW